MSTTLPPSDSDQPPGKVLDFPATRSVARPEGSVQHSKVYEGEIVDESGPALVDRPGVADDDDDRPIAERLARLTKARRPILASWLRSWTEFLGVIKWAAVHLGHILAFHAVRSPIYGGRLLLRAP